MEGLGGERRQSLGVEFGRVTHCLSQARVLSKCDKDGWDLEMRKGR